MSEEWQNMLPQSEKDRIKMEEGCRENHKWEKLGGPQNVGGGKFRQFLICKSCGKIKRVID